ncbi:hypothetical protein MM213_12055 [Belliella sp. R4-6]|uniref:Lipocalin-like domain-containing protein n=1 Tax=Belliella alkalica TaxID=1730871 RepID=A0ABS9VDV8_9BACT|nr:hypothetical protein [Belliella alkalica]MCH7414225.1 hypothetical protein [Belliella alkalica]
MRGILMNITLGLSAIALFIMVTQFGNQPTDDIIGVWKEVSWDYEKVDFLNQSDSLTIDEVMEQTKVQLGESFVIHKAEVWEFIDNSTLKVDFEDGNEEIVDWKLKSKGDILKLTHENNVYEYYTIKELNKDRMVLHFHIDLNARGIVKLTFEKV